MITNLDGIFSSGAAQKQGHLHNLESLLQQWLRDKGPQSCSHLYRGFAISAGGGQDSLFCVTYLGRVTASKSCLLSTRFSFFP
ncbi:MAG: hypothetical protein C5B47_06020 [Verrucomicrobia bacterium]|nr:MAG: hypothetical protein C5B47_06020 [Verrucomicrobiota bacterium]